MIDRWTWHGGGLNAAQAHFGDRPEPWADLSTGINPHGWSAPSSLFIDWSRLPDEGDLRALEAAAARYFGCATHHVCAVPGTETGIRLVGSLISGPTRFRTPSYRTHADMVAGSLAVPHAQLDDADGASLILANPNNPDGHLLDRATMADLLDRRGSQGWLIVDEAFIDCHTEHSLADRIDDSNRLIIFRSFGKFFGLAGLRLGFVLGPRTLIETLRHQLGAWPVSAAAITLGTAAYSDAGWISATRERLFHEAQKLDMVLNTAGYPPQGACPLFRLINCPSAPTLFNHLAHHALLTRPFEQNDRWLRIGLPGDRAVLNRLKKALIHA